MHTIAVTDRNSTFAQQHKGPSIDFCDVSAPALAEAAVIILAPEKPGEPAIETILGWKDSGLIAGKILLATYKGREWASGRYCPELSHLIDAYIVHHSAAAKQPKAHYIALSVDGEPAPAAPQAGAFVGGRKMRDFALAKAAIENHPATIISDRWDQGTTTTWNATTERVNLTDYRAAIEASAFVIVPAQPNPDEPHGQSDCARAVRAGKPLLVTRNATCNDYTRHKITGYLANPTPEDFKRGAEYIRDNLKQLTKNARLLSYMTSHKFYQYKLSNIVNSILDNTEISGGSPED